MPAPNPLWSGDRDPGLREPDPDAPTQPFVAQPRPRTEPPTERLETSEPQAEPEPAAVRAPAPATSSAKRGRVPLVLAAVLGAILAAGIFSLGALLTGDDSSDDGGGDTTAAATQSGSSTSKPLKPLNLSKGGGGATQAAAVYKAAGKSVIEVKRSGGSGSGFIVEGQGLIVTNNHVVGSARQVQVVLDPGVKPVDAQVIGTDASSDLAVLKVNPDTLNGRPALQLADSDDVGVGDLAVAIGYPLGLDRTVTSGIISGVGRHLDAPNGFSIDRVLQTDAPINPGNSGGPLLDARGRVIGVNSQIATAGSQGNVGIGFSVPSNTVASVVPQLAAGRKISRPYLGVSTQPPSDGSQGAEVADVIPGGPSDAAGLQAPAICGGSGGDIITSIAGQAVKTTDDVAAAIENRQPGDKVDIRVRRDGTSKALSLTLGTRPPSASSAQSTCSGASGSGSGGTFPGIP